MSTNPCNAASLLGILSSLQGSSLSAQQQAIASANLANQARSVAVASNSNNVAFGSAATGEIIRGLRNRLFLKYAGIDYEFYNRQDLQYRSDAP
jgi:hypothetical protein